MSAINIKDVTVLDNPAPFLNPFQFEISYECLTSLKDDSLCCVSENNTFKKKALSIHEEIRKFAQKAMDTTDVRVDVKLNKQIWSRGIRSIPRRIRVRIACKRNDDEDAKEELCSLVTVAEIPEEGLKGLGTQVIEDEE